MLIGLLDISPDWIPALHVVQTTRFLLRADSFLEGIQQTLIKIRSFAHPFHANYCSHASMVVSVVSPSWIVVDMGLPLVKSR